MIVFGHIHDVGMWELQDGEAACFQLISFFCLFIGKTHAESWCLFVVSDLVIYATYDHNKYSDYC